jgi:replicative DNA helicase
MSTDPVTDRLPPHNKEAERGVIGGILRDPDTLPDVQQIIRADNFYFDAHQKIYQAICDLSNDHQPFDIVLVHERLKLNKQLEDVGGHQFLADLWDAVPTGANVEYHAKIVRDTAMVRSLIHAGNEILRDSYDRTQSADELVSQAERKIMEIARTSLVGETRTLTEAIHDALHRLDGRIGKDNLAISGLPTGYVDLDNLLAGLQNSELVIIAARPSVGKCVTADTEIVLADGSVATVEDLFRRRSARLFTLSDDLKLTFAEPSAYVDDGVKPVFRVRTRLGREIEATAAHPFRTFRGWTRLEHLRVGDRIAVPRCLPVFGNQPMRDCEVKLLGYLIGDGGLTDTTPEFTNSNPRLRDEFIAAVQEFGGLTSRTEDSGGSRTPTVCVSSDPAFVVKGRSEFGQRLATQLTQRGASRRLALALGVAPASVTHWVQGKTAPDEAIFTRLCDTLRLKPEELAPHGINPIRKNGKNPLTVWLSELGLWGKGAKDKFIPTPIFTLPREQLAVFLNRLFATDGWATVTNGNGRFGFASVSERLVRQIQHLLLRFGVIARLRARQIKYRNTRRPAWQLDIIDPNSVRTFTTEIGIFGKEEAVGRVREANRGKGAKTNRDLIPVEVWADLERAKGEAPWAEVAERMGLPRQTNLHVGTRSLSRGRLRRFATALGSEELAQLAQSDVYWDEIVSIEPTGNKQVYDLTIPETHNFIANDLCVHNTAFALNVVRNIITSFDPKEPPPVVLFVSLEMSRIELAERLLCCQSRVDSHKVRKGHLNSDDIQKLMDAGDVLRKARLYLDDTPSRSMIQIAATARRLQKKHEREGGLRLVVIDYLQLIEPENRRDPRQEQVAQISRRLKFLARELQLPVIALAQVNRASEDRQDHKPRLADLRESGCLTGETLIPLADGGERVPLRSLVGRTGLRVWALHEESLKLEPATVSHAFSTGVKPVFRLETRLGRVIRATANHPFRGFAGWKRLDTLRVGDRLALPRVMQPEGLRHHSPGQRPGNAIRPMTRQPEGLGQSLVSQPFRLHWLLAPRTQGVALGYGVSALRAAFSSLAAEEQTPAQRVSATHPFGDVYWDEVVSITPDGEEEVFDLTVPGPHNFVANGFVVHNSIEQDADTCMMLHRPGKFDGTQEDNILEVIIAKQRNGPTGEVTLTYLKQFNRYENYIADAGYGDGVL